MQHQHKIAVLKYAKGNFWLLIFPIVRSLFSMNFNFYYWLRGAFWDIFVVSSIFILAFLRWNFVRYKITDMEIYVSYGTFIKGKVKLPLKSISGVCVYTPFLMKPFKASVISFYTDADFAEKRSDNSELKLILNKTECSQILSKIPIDLPEIKIICESPKKDLIIFSLLFSSSLSGIIFIGTVFMQLSRLADEKFSERILSALDNAMGTMSDFFKGVTPLTAAVILMFFFGWIISFLINLVHHLRFTVCRRGENIFLKNGSLSYWKYYVNISRINYADLHQNLVMKIFKIMSVNVSCSGYRKRKNQVPVFVPITTVDRVRSTMRAILPDFTQSNISLRPIRTYFIVYVWFPLIMSVAIPVAEIFLKRNFIEWGEIIHFVSAVSELSVLYLLAVKIVGRVGTGIGRNDSAITIKYCKRIRFHTVIVPVAKVACVEIRQSFFQIRKRSCDLIVCTRGDGFSRHRIRGLMLDDAKQFVTEYDKIS